MTDTTKGYILYVHGNQNPIVGVAESAGHALRLAIDIEDVKGWAVRIYPLWEFNQTFNALHQFPEPVPALG